MSKTEKKQLKGIVGISSDDYFAKKSQKNVKTANSNTQKAKVTSKESQKTVKKKTNFKASSLIHFIIKIFTITG